MKKILHFFFIISMCFILSFSTISANAAEISYNNVSADYNSYTTQIDATLPSKYDATEQGYISPIKEQTGSICWAFSAVSAFESILLKNDAFIKELSTSAMDLWATPTENGEGWQRTLGSQGYELIPMGYFTSWQGPVTTDDETVNVGVTAIEYLDKNNPTKIKNAIMKYGGVVGNYNAISEGNNSDNTAFIINQPTNRISGHSIFIVGWDDNYDKSNFDGDYTPVNNGAWLCKNSWGDYNSLGGYFWVSYEDFYILNDDFFTTGYTLKDHHIIKENDNIYQNEIYGATYEFDYIQSNNITYTNVFDFSQEGNILDKIVFETTALGSDYTIYYAPTEYSESTDTYIPIDDKTQWLKLQEGTVDYKGYICCDVDDTILSQTYGAIAIEIDTTKINNDLSSNNTNYIKNSIGVCEWLVTENGESIFTQQSQKGECFITYENTTMDLYDVYTKNGDDIGGTFVIKAITNNTVNTTVSGDVNFDEKVNINDVTNIQKYLAKYIKYPMTHQKQNADFNKDNIINIKDATAIQLHLLNK